jgi:putative general porin
MVAELFAAARLEFRVVPEAGCWGRPMSGLSLSMRLLSASVAAVAAALPAQAEEYSWQLSGVARHAETPGVGMSGLDTDSWAVDGTYYLNPIDDGDGPFALASFLNPTTHLSAEASKTDLPFDYFRGDPTGYTLSGAYLLPGQKWYVGANYAKADSDHAGFFTDSKGYGVEAGVYVGANTTLELGLGRSEESWVMASSCSGSTGSPTVCFGPWIETDTTADSVGFEVFHLRRFGSLTYSLQGSVLESETEFRSSSTLGSADGLSLRTYSVAGELFPTKALGVRLGYTQVEGEGEGYDGDSYDVVGTWFFKPRFAIQLGLSRSSHELGLDETESAAIRFIGRL